MDAVISALTNKEFVKESLSSEGSSHSWACSQLGKEKNDVLFTMSSVHLCWDFSRTGYSDMAAVSQRRLLSQDLIRVTRPTRQ